MQSRTTATGSGAGAFWAAVCGVAAAGLLVRIACSFQSFWLDEIWSYYLAQDLDSVWDVFTQTKHDNNHILNTLFIYWMGEHEHWLAYRLLAIATGSASLLVLARVALRWGRLESLTAVALVAASFAMIQASAQARGYAPAIFCSLAAYELCAVWRERPSVPVLVSLWLVCALGLLSHLTFLYAYLSVVLWHGWREWSERRAPGAVLASLAKIHGVPLLLVAALYWGFYREIVIGGGPRDWKLAVVARRAIASAFAAPGDGVPALLAVIAAAGIAVAGALLLRRERTEPGLRGQWLFFAGVLVLVPALILIVAEPRLLFPRYFWAAFPYFYLLAAFVLAWVFRRSTAGRVAYAVAMIAFVAANGLRVGQLLSTGQTNYSDAIDYLEQHTPTRLVRVGGDHNFRNQMVLRFYSRHRDSDKRFVYLDESSWPKLGPRWYLSHSWLAGSNPPRHLTLAGGRRYTLEKRFENGIGYGWTWYLYRNDALPPDPPG